MGAARVAALFVRADSVYHGMAADCYTIERDARTYAGPLPVVAHPPCRAWGRLSHMAKPRHDEKELGQFAIACIRIYGGVMEHPAHLKLWPAGNLPEPGKRDAWGGFTLPLLQSWWGHRAPKSTWIYVCGIEPREVPPMRFELGAPAGRIENMGRREREATPPELAAWLVDLASRCRRAEHRIAA